MSASATLRTERDRGSLIRFIQSLPLAKPWVFEWRPWVKTRSSAANAIMHITWREFGQHFGWEENEVKEFFKERYGPKVERRIGDVTELVPKSTTKYSTQEAWAMIDKTGQIAAESGCYLEMHQEKREVA